MLPASPSQLLVGLSAWVLWASVAAEEASPPMDGLWAAAGGVGDAPDVQMNFKSNSGSIGSSSSSRDKNRRKSLRSRTLSISQTQAVSMGVVSGMLTQLAVNWLYEHPRSLLKLLRRRSKLGQAAAKKPRRGMASQKFSTLATLVASLLAVAFSVQPARRTWMVQMLKVRFAAKTCSKAPAKAPAKAKATAKAPAKGKAPPPPKATALAKAKAHSKAKMGARPEDEALPIVAPFGRRIHWVSPVYGDSDSIGSTVFGTLERSESNSPGFDRNLLTAMWKEEDGQVSRKRSLANKPPGKAVLDTNRAQVIGIAISKIRLPIMEMCRLVTSFDTTDSRLLLDDIELLAAAMPSMEERTKLQRHENEVEMLRDVEQKVMPLCNLSPGRLRLMKLALTHEEVHRSVAHRCQVLGEAAEEARTSVPFKRFLGMALQIGNFINTGEATAHKGTVRGFGVESLSILGTCKKGPVSAMHFLCLTIRSSDTEFLDKLLESLRHVHMASRERVAALKGAAVDFGKEADFVKSQLESCGEEETLRDALSLFWDAIARERRDVDHLLASALQTVTEAQAYFNVLGNRKAQPPAEEFFKHIASFLDVFRAAWIDTARHGDRWQKRYEQTPEKPELAEVTGNESDTSTFEKVTDMMSMCSSMPERVEEVDIYSDKTLSGDERMDMDTRQASEECPRLMRRGSWRRQLHKAGTIKTSVLGNPQQPLPNTSQHLARKKCSSFEIMPDNAGQAGKQGLCSWYALHADDTDSEEEIGLPVNALLRAATAFSTIIPDDMQRASGDFEQDPLRKQTNFDSVPDTCRLLRSWIEWMPQEVDFPRLSTV